MKDWKKSNNEKFFIIINFDNEKKGMVEAIVLESHTFNEINRLFVKADFGGSRFAVSDDGKYIATGMYDSKSIYVYDVMTGQQVYKKSKLGQIQRVDFGVNEDTLWVGLESNKLLLINFISDTIESKIDGNMLLKNYRDDELIVMYKDRVCVKEIRRRSSTFAFLTGCYTKLGLAMSEVRGNLKFFNDAGKIQWCAYLMDGNHFLTVAYDEEQARIYGIARNYEKKGCLKFYCFAEESGKELFCEVLEGRANIILDYCKKIVSLDGRVYKILDNGIELISNKVFDF